MSSMEILGISSGGRFSSILFFSVICNEICPQIGDDPFLQFFDEYEYLSLYASMTNGGISVHNL